MSDTATETSNTAILENQDKPSQENKHTQQETKKTLAQRIQLILVLAVIVAVTVTVVWFLWLQPLQSQPAAQSPTRHHNTTASSTPADKLVASINNTDQATTPEPEKNTIIKTMAAPEKEPPAAQKVKKIATDLNAVATQIDRPNSQVKNSLNEAQLGMASDTQKALALLRGDIEDLRSVTASLRQQLVRQQQQQLLNTLNQLMSVNTTLPQLLLFWQGAAFQDGISSAQRKQALAMATLAKQDIKQINQWLTTLKKASPQSQNTPSKNIIPDTYWWQRWLGKHLSLRRLPDKTAQSNIKLTKTINAMIHIISQEQWADQAAWHKLLKELSSHDLAFNVPKDISHIAKDKNNMRHIAQQWKESIQ